MDNQNNEIKLNTKPTNKLITDYFKSVPKNKIIKGYNPLTDHYHCLECGRDMGDYPGQLCRKTFCDNF